VRQLLRTRELTQAIVFVNSKLGAARLARSFERDGLRTAALHGDKSQDERLKSLAAFKAGEVDLLVATDVAARGLDIADLPAVFNFDVPFNAEDYVHRIGRTGRAGASGLAVTMVTRKDARQVDEIEKLIKRKLDIEPLELEDDRPRRPRRDDGDEGRHWAPRDDDRQDRPARSEGREGRGRTTSASADPFFDKPYEEPQQDAQPAWDSARAATPARSLLSSNIRPRKRVAALLGGKAGLGS
jgi:superfamily II DNA/RNA helicase